MSAYVAFALNLAACVFNVGILIHDPTPSGVNLIGAILAALGVRVMFPIVCRRLRS